MLGIGEIGLNRVTRNEIATYTEQIEMAAAHRQLVLIHTPHLEDKHKGTRITLDVLRRYPELRPARVLVDHAEEHTIEAILDHGYWAGLTLYPQTKISPQRAVDVIEQYGPDRICVAGACDWGPSDPIAVPRFAMEMRRRAAPGDAHPPGHLREPVDVPEPVAEVPAAGGRRRRRAGSRRLGGERACSSIGRPASTSPTAPTSIRATAGRAVDANIRRYAPALKARLSPDAAVRPRPAAVRARRARAARGPAAGRRSTRGSRTQGLYVALINGFPYGPFHGTPVKAEVYAPDWRDDARVDYTRDLIRILARLLPRGMDGGVSTSPLTYKPWMAAAGADAMQVMALQRRADRGRAGRGARASTASSSISTSSPNPTACSRPAPRRSTSSSSGCCRSAAPPSPPASG